jgi:hypothetical protein
VPAMADDSQQRCRASDADRPAIVKRYAYVHSTKRCGADEAGL